MSQVDDKHFLMTIVLSNENLNITEACEEASKKLGVKATTLRITIEAPMGGWTIENERKLLLTLLPRDKSGGWDEVAAAMGQGFTGNAIRQKFYKLKRESEALYSGGGAAAPATPATGSSKKAAAKTKATSKSTAKATSAKRKSMSDDAVDEDVEDTPSKTKKAKVDVDDEDGEDED